MGRDWGVRGKGGIDTLIHTNLKCKLMNFTMWMLKPYFKDQISDLWQLSTFSDNTPHYAMSPVNRLLSIMCIYFLANAFCLLLYKRSQTLNGLIRGDCINIKLLAGLFWSNTYRWTYNQLLCWTPVVNLNVNLLIHDS